MSDEYVKKEDVLRIVSIATFSVDQVVSAIKNLPTCTIPNSAGIEKEKTEEVINVYDCIYENGTYEEWGKDK